jgi:DNA mismatch repair protein MutL
MPEISILPENLVNKIAAGEVIERPASVVRELIDNSIDAGATRIDIEILHGGKRLIRVTDNGSGMDRDDAILSIERHATSKLKTEDDLFRISTLGFRGEALPAIASVSKLTLITSRHNGSEGTRVEVHPGGKKMVIDAPPVSGTVVEVRDIFYNTPARRKFLKATSTELSHIIDVVTQRALAYPWISFTLRHNNNELLNTRTTDSLKERLEEVYGGEFVSDLMEIQGEAEGIRVHGFISMPSFHTKRRTHQFIFINRRAVRNPLISHAIYTSYGQTLPKDRHPVFFLFLELEPGMVDVNVHPAKMEVRFESPETIHRCVEEAVYEALHHNDREERGPQESSYDSGIKEEGSVREDSLIEDFKGSQTDFFDEGIATPPPPRYFRIGEAFIATITDNGLMIVDQHAAHERILYERFLGMADTAPEPLFLPVRVELPPREYEVILRHREDLRGFGIEIEEFGGRDVIVRAIPGELHRSDIRGLLLDLASGIIEYESSGIRQEDELREGIASKLACHRSVRGKEPLNDEEIVTLLRDLDRCREPDRCPHGRPTRILISMDELRRMFGRR